MAKILEKNARKIILVHNHPSGDNAPSEADIQLTQKLKDVFKPFGVAILDHIIVGDEPYSFQKWGHL